MPGSNHDDTANCKLEVIIPEKLVDQCFDLGFPKPIRYTNKNEANRSGFDRQRKVEVSCDDYTTITCGSLPEYQVC